MFASSLLFTHLTHQTLRLLLLTQKGRKVLKPTEWNHRGRKPWKKINKSPTNIKFIETKSGRKPLRRRWQTFPVLGRVLQLCESVATFPQLLNHSSGLYKNGGKMQTSPCLKINYSQSSPGACWLRRDAQSEHVRVHMSTWRFELSRLP